MIQVQQLFIYPVKSLRGFTIDTAMLSTQGLHYDRQWMVINSDNHFITQRKYPQMVLVHTQIKDHHLILSKPDQPEITSLAIAIDQVPTGAAFTAKVWKDDCQVIDEGADTSAWISQALGSATPLRIVRMASQPRPQSKPHLLGANTHTYFADAAPFLVTNQASLKAVNQQMRQEQLAPVTMEHFRPNIVINGLAAFAEHTIDGLQHDGDPCFHYQLRHCYPCQRCIMPTIDIETGIAHPKQQPFSLIADINAMPDKPKAPAFGENATLISGAGNAIRVGDRLNIVNG